MNLYFLDVTITGTFTIYGEPKQMTWELNGVFAFSEEELCDFVEALVKRYCPVVFEGHTWSRDKVDYKWKMRALNKL